MKCDRCGKNFSGEWIETSYKKGTEVRIRFFCSNFCYMLYHKREIDSWKHNLEIKLFGSTANECSWCGAEISDSESFCSEDCEVKYNKVLEDKDIVN